MFKLAFKFLPVKVEGKIKKNKKKHCNVCEYPPPRKEGYSCCARWSVLFSQGPSLEWFGNDKLRRTADKNAKG